MSIQASSVTTKAVRLKSPTGIFLEATAVTYSSGTGEAVFSLSKPYSALDDGLWEIYSADTDRISDIAGNFLAANQKLGEFIVGEVDPTQDAIAKADAEIAALKAKQDAQTLALQKATQSVTDLAILVAGGAGGASNTELKTLQDKLTALEKDKADKTALDTLDATVTALKTALADGATDKELAEAIAKVDAAIALTEASIKPLTGRVLYTTTGVTDAQIGDSIYIDLPPGGIRLPSSPIDGGEIKILDPLSLIKIGENDILPGVGDRIGAGQGSVGPNDPSALTFDKDDQLQGGFIRLKYRKGAKTWDVFIVYGAPVSVASGGGTSTGGDRLVTALLALLPANQWTDWPALAGADAGKAITLDSIQSSTGDDWTNRLEVDRVRQRVRSLSSYSDVQFTYEVH